MKTTMSLAAAMGCLAATSANAAITLTNPSFEDTTSTSPPTGWTRSSGVNFQSRGAAGGLNPTDGTRMAWTNNGFTGYQTVGEVIQLGTTYTLTVDVGTTGFATSTGTFRLYGDAGFATAIGGAESAVAVTTNATWITDQSVSFTATAAEAGQLLGVSFGTTGGVQNEWDNLRLTAVAVPEPTTTALLGLGGLALILRRRR